MNRFQFSLRDLFLATTLIAFGVGGICIADRWYNALGEHIVVLICLGSAAAIGAGIGAPFHKKLAGAITCFSLAFASYAIGQSFPFHDN